MTKKNGRFRAIGLIDSIDQLAKKLNKVPEKRNRLDRLGFSCLSLDPSELESMKLLDDCFSLSFSNTRFLLSKLRHVAKMKSLENRND